MSVKVTVPALLTPLGVAPILLNRTVTVHVAAGASVVPVQVLALAAKVKVVPDPPETATPVTRA